jgi:hypothetical protein
MLTLENTFTNLGKISQIELIEELLGRGRISSISLNLVEQENGSFNQLILSLVETAVLESAEMTSQNLTINVFDGNGIGSEHSKSGEMSM